MDLEKLSQWAKRQLSVIITDIPELKENAYLVFSSRYGQCDLTDDKSDIYRYFPAFFLQNEHHEKINQLLYSKVIDNNKDTENKKNELQKLLDTIEISGDVNIEFRFTKMNYKALELLKNHPLVRQPEHMMRPAWIRIILISLNDESLRAMFE